MSKLTHLVRLAVTFGLIHATPLAEAQGRPACADRKEVVQRLADRYGETLHSMGLHADNGLVEVYASDATGTWTILFTSPDGIACLLASGQSWEQESTPAAAKPGHDI